MNYELQIKKTKVKSQKSEKMEFEFALMKLPQWLGQKIKLEESELVKQIYKFRKDNLK